MKEKKTIHTGRTMMFAELEKVMNYGTEIEDFNEALNANVANKLSKSNLLETNSRLRRLYRFDNNDIWFRSFRHYWHLTDQGKKSIITILYAISNDYLLSESIDLVVGARIGDRIAIEKFDKNIEKYHPGNYSDNTRRSAAQNIASSWKQAGYIQGKVKNIRSKVVHDYYTVAFALLMSYLNGDRGDYILMSRWVKALALGTDELRDLIKEAAKRDLLQYQYGGNVTTISFENQLQTLK
jgi:hypothetical protein